MPDSSTSPQRRRRRSTETVRQLVLTAATDVFAERGFDGATTRQIAERAGVSEQVMFNQFESKERLYEATVLEPFARFAQEHIDSWTRVPIAELDPREMLSGYVRDLYQFVIEQRALFLALGEDRFGAPTERILARLDRVSEEMAALHRFTFDIAVGVRIAFSATTSLAMHQATLLPRHGHEAIIAELTSTLVTGLLRDSAQHLG